MDNSIQLSKATIVLHWLIGLSIIGLIAVGFYMTTTRELWLLPYHKSIGVIVFFFVIVRIVWRYKNGWPVPVSRYAHWEHTLAKLIHWVLILGTLAMPLSGMLDSAAGGHGFGIFTLELFPANHSPDGKAIAYSSFLSNAGDLAHEVIGYFMVAAITLHVIGALKHHFIDGDRTLRRMLGH